MGLISQNFERMHEAKLKIAGGGGGSNQKPFCGGGGYFLESHNTVKQVLKDYIK